MIHWVSGPAYAGKTTFLYRLTKTLCDRGERVFFFVPEQQTAAVEADLFSLCGNTANEYLEVLNFQRLPNRVFRALGGLVDQSFGKTRRVLLLAQVLQGLKEHLSFFVSGIEDADVLASLLSFIETLSRSHITPEELEALAQEPQLQKETQLCKKLRDSALILAAYDKAARAECGDRTPDEQRRLIELLDARGDCNFFEGATVLIDGFYDFTAPENELILRMGRMAKDLYLSFLSQEGQEELFFRSERARRTLEKLCEGIASESLAPGSLLPERKSAPPADLAFLCDHVSRAPGAPYPDPPERIRVVCAKTPLDEVRLTLQEIFLLYAQDRIKFSDCAVLYRDGGLYGALLREEAERCGIPLYTGERKTLLSSPLALFFRCAAQIAAGDTRAQTLINLLQTGLVPLKPVEIGLLQRYIRTWNLSGDALYQTEKPYTASTRAYQNLVTKPLQDAAAAELAAVNAAKDRLYPLILRLKQGFAAPDFAGKVAALKRFAEDCGVQDLLSQRIADLRRGGRFSEAAVEEGLFSACLNALDALGALSGQTSAGGFYAYLKIALSFLSVGSLPSSPSSLTAGEISFTRLKKVRRLYLLGVNASLFPASNETPGMLSDREKELCASLAPQFDLLQSGGSLEEYFYFYLAASTPTDALTISYHTQSLSGEKRTKSVFIDRLAFLFPKLFENEKGEQIKPEPVAPMSLPINESMLYAYLCTHRNDADPFTLSMRRYAEKNKLFSLPLTEDQIAQSRDTRSPVEPRKGLTLSQSKLETYARCPYRYFLKYDLFLSPDPLAQVDASIVGELTHYVAEYGYRYLIEENKSPQDFDRDALVRLVRNASKAYFSQKMAGDILHTTRFFAQAGRMERANLRLMENLFSDSTQSAYQPFLFEAGLGHELPPYVLRLPDGTNAKFSGKVDRVDLANTPNGLFACVIDYKTGTHKLNLNDVYNGLETQLFVYLCALRRGGVFVNNKRLAVTPAAAFYLNAYADIPEAETAEDAQKKISAKLARHGLYLDNESAINAFGSAANHGFAYSKSKGLHAKSGSALLKQSDLDLMLDAMEDQFRATALAIKSGVIERRPLKRQETRIGCDYCEYRSICRMDARGACRPYRWHDYKITPEETEKTEVTGDE